MVMNPPATVRSVRRRALMFAGCLAGLYALSLLPVFTLLLEWSVSANATLACAVLNLLGQRTHVVGSSITSAHFTVTVLGECTAAGLIACFWAALLVAPGPWRRRGAGLAMGTVVLAGLNVLRIVTVFLVGVHVPGAFSIIHEEVWPGLMAIAVLALALGAIRWTAGDWGAGGRVRAGLMPSGLARFTLIFGLLLIPWPGLATGCARVLSDAGSLVFTSATGAREVTFELLGDRETRIAIVNRRLMNGDGSGPVRNLDFNTVSVAWRPFVLLFALVVATPLTLAWRIRTLGLVGAALLLYLGLTLAFSLWNESTEVSLTVLSPFWKLIANGVEGALLEMLGLAVPVLLWLLIAAPALAAPASLGLRKEAAARS